MPGVNDNNMECFLAYGASIRTDRDLKPYLPQAGNGRLTLTVIRMQGNSHAQKLERCFPQFQGHGRTLSIFTDRKFDKSSAGQPWCFEVEGVAKFYWIGGDTSIQYDVMADEEDKLLAFWLIHIFLPLWFTLEGHYEFIHAGAVEIDGEPVLFMAPSMGGKSTLTDYFLQQGHGLISDDKVAIVKEQERFLALPSHPNHRPYRQFEDLGKPVDNFLQKTLPISAIYYLRSAEPEASICINEIVGHRKFAGMRPSYLFDFDFLKVERLEFLAELAGAVPFFELSVPWDRGRLGEVHDALCSHHAVSNNQLQV